MGKVFNLTTGGSATVSTTLTRAMTTANALFDTGTAVVSLTSSAANMKFATPITVEAAVKGVFLNIASVAANATGTITIILSCNASNVFTRTYGVSALLKDVSTGTGYTVPQYWQGFDIGNLTLPINTFVLSVTCSNPGEVSLVAGASNNYNRYIIPNAFTNALFTLDAAPTLCVGSYLQPINNGITTLTPATVSCINIGYANTVYGVKAWNGGTITISAPSTSFSGDFLATPGGTINIVPPLSLIHI